MFGRDLGYGKPVYESRRSGKGTRYIEILRLQIDPAAQSGTQGKGFVTISGRINRDYFQERLYQMQKGVKDSVGI